VIGVADPRSAARVARVLHALGVQRALVVHGEGVDELPLDGSGVAYNITPAGVRRRRVVAARLGLRRAPSTDLRGGTASDNARIIQAVLSGAENGARRDVVMLNAGAALLVAGRAKSLPDGVRRAGRTIDSGAAIRLLERLRAAA
jgi:anthranilate phosphoribosyltransferase